MEVGGEKWYTRITINDFKEGIVKENLIKSKKRVQQHGEVFTPAWMVQKMLDTPGIKEACEDIQATFLEPSAGDGNFLQAILERKLASLVSRYPKSTWKDQSLVALSSIYGIEYLADNLQVAKARLFLYYLNWYEENFGTKLSSRSDIYKSAHFLIEKNIVRGNTLTQSHPDTGEGIWFNEWQLVQDRPVMIKRIPFALSELIGKEATSQPIQQGEQMSFFDLDEEFMVEEKSKESIKIEEVNIQKVYLLGE